MKISGLGCPSWGPLPTSEPIIESVIHLLTTATWMNQRAQEKGMHVTTELNHSLLLTKPLSLSSPLLSNIWLVTLVTHGIVFQISLISNSTINNQNHRNCPVSHIIINISWGCWDGSIVRSTSCLENAQWPSYANTSSIPRWEMLLNVFKNVS